MRCIIILSLIWVAAYKSDEMGKLMEIVKKTHFSIDMNGETYFSDLGKGWAKPVDENGEQRTISSVLKSRKTKRIEISSCKPLAGVPVHVTIQPVSVQTYRRENAFTEEVLAFANVQIHWDLRDCDSVSGYAWDENLDRELENVTTAEDHLSADICKNMYDHKGRKTVSAYARLNVAFIGSSDIVAVKG